MINLSDIARKRSILLSARVRFSPQTQPIRETAIDKIVEQNLLIGEGNTGLSLEDIEKQGALCFAGGAPAISRTDLRKSLDRLIASDRVLPRKVGDGITFSLAEPARKELWELQTSTEGRFRRVVCKLFANSEQPAEIFSAPFLELLCTVFARLAESYVKLLKGEISQEDLARSPSISVAVQEVLRKFKNLDRTFFQTAVYSFFRDSDPDYDPVKWNLAQNYYVAKALGLDPSGHLLSDEVFGNADLYLDTNVVIQALEPIARHYRSFQALSAACKKLNIHLKVCQISVDELRHVVEYQRELIGKVAEQIPDQTAPKVRGIFFQLYRQKKAATGKVDLDELFASFCDPMDKLRGSYQVELVDHSWFDKVEDDLETSKLVRTVKRESLSRRGREKGNRSATHDSLLLRWIDLQRQTTGKRSWIITLDTALSSCIPDGVKVGKKPGAITLIAFLQWISPIAIREELEEDMAAIFSEAVRYQLLPQDSFFNLRDFLMFAEMEMSCKELPAEDVEGCIRYVRSSVPTLDPTNPVDREKLSHEISRFMADPGRKYKQEVQRLEAELAKQADEALEMVQSAEAKASTLEQAVGQLRTQLFDQDRLQKDEALKSSAQLRATMVSSFSLVVFAIITVLSATYGTGENWLQKILNSWPVFTMWLGASVGGFGICLGRARIRALGWPWNKWLGDDNG